MEQASRRALSMGGAAALNRGSESWYGVLDADRANAYSAQFNLFTEYDIFSTRQCVLVRNNLFPTADLMSDTTDWATTTATYPSSGSASRSASVHQAAVFFWSSPPPPPTGESITWRYFDAGEKYFDECQCCFAARNALTA